MLDSAGNLTIAPTAAIIAWGLLLVTGLILWTAGRRVLKPVSATIALLCGALIGWTFVRQFSLDVPPWMVAVISAIIFMSLALLAFRAVIAVGMAAIFAVAAPMAIWGGAELRAGVDGDTQTLAMGGAAQEAPPASDVPDLLSEFEDIDPWWQRGEDPESTDESLPPLPETPGDSENEAPSEAADSDAPTASELLGLPEGVPLDLALGKEAGARMEEAANYLNVVREWGDSLWQRTPSELRPSMIGAAILGALAGLLVGTLASSVSISIVTSFGGSLLWLSSSLVLASEIGNVQKPEEMLSGSSWLMLWGVIAVIGLAIQWTFRTSRADKHA